MVKRGGSFLLDCPSPVAGSTRAPGLGSRPWSMHRAEEPVPHQTPVALELPREGEGRRGLGPLRRRLRPVLFVPKPVLLLRPVVVALALPPSVHLEHRREELPRPGRHPLAHVTRVVLPVFRVTPDTSLFFRPHSRSPTVYVTRTVAE